MTYALCTSCMLIFYVKCIAATTAAGCRKFTIPSLRCGILPLRTAACACFTLRKRMALLVLPCHRLLTFETTRPVVTGDNLRTCRDVWRAVACRIPSLLRVATRALPFCELCCVLPGYGFLFCTYASFGTLGRLLYPFFIFLYAAPSQFMRLTAALPSYHSVPALLCALRLYATNGALPHCALPAATWYTCTLLYTYAAMPPLPFPSSGTRSYVDSADGLPATCGTFHRAAALGSRCGYYLDMLATRATAVLSSLLFYTTFFIFAVYVFTLSEPGGGGLKRQKPSARRISAKKASELPTGDFAYWRLRPRRRSGCGHLWTERVVSRPPQQRVYRSMLAWQSMACSSLFLTVSWSWFYFLVGSLFSNMPWFFLFC